MTHIFNTSKISIDKSLLWDSGELLLNNNKIINLLPEENYKIEIVIMKMNNNYNLPTLFINDMIYFQNVNLNKFTVKLNSYKDIEELNNVIKIYD